MAEPNITPPILTPQDIQRFWSKVDKTPGQGPHGDCWTRGTRADYTGTKYGMFKTGAGRRMQNHRLAYFIVTGQWLRDLCGCHTCDYKPCCRPDHIFPGTKGDNNRDCYQKGRHPIMRGDLHGGAKLTAQIVLQMREAYKTGRYSFDELGRKYDVTYSTAHLAIIGQTWPHVPGAVPGKSCTSYGSKVGTAVLTEEQVREIRRRHKPGDGYRELARDYGVSNDAIGKIIKGINWKHLKDE